MEHVYETFMLIFEVKKKNLFTIITMKEKLPVGLHSSTK